MATLCQRCGGVIADIYLAGAMHNCWRPGKFNTDPLTPPTTRPVKCAQCGSTTIDHTEVQCSLNRLSKPRKNNNG